MELGHPALWVSCTVMSDHLSLAALPQVLPLDRVELDPGDCLFFHSNLLHQSAANERSVCAGAES